MCRFLILSFILVYSKYILADEVVLFSEDAIICATKESMVFTPENCGSSLACDIKRLKHEKDCIPAKNMRIELQNTSMNEENSISGKILIFHQNNIVVYALKRDVTFVTENNAHTQSLTYTKDTYDEYGWQRYEGWCRNGRAFSGFRPPSSQIHDAHGPNGTFVGSREEAVRRACGE